MKKEDFPVRLFILQVLPKVLIAPILLLHQVPFLDPNQMPTKILRN
jgi:hypothetical protein